MSNHSIPAAAPGLPPVTRRHVMAIMAALSTGSVSGTIAALAAPSDEKDETAMTGAEREALLDAYNVWLDMERRYLAFERADGDRERFDAYMGTLTYDGHRAATYHNGEHAPASSRAASVLAAIGCAWRKDAK